MTLCRTWLLPCLAVVAMIRVAAALDVTPVISALKEQDYRTALALAKQLRVQDSLDPRIPTLEGMADEGLKNRVDALRDYRAALAIKPDYVPALKALAQLEYATGDKDASKSLAAIVKLVPGDQVSHAMLAALEYQGHDCDRAIAEYEMSGEAIAQKPEALTQYGECLLVRRRADEAVAVLTRAAELRPNEWWPRYNLAIGQLSDGKPREAFETLAPALTDRPIEPDVLALAAEASEASGDTPLAVKLLREAILGKPTKEAYYLDFADLSFDHQSFRVGVDMIDAGLTKLPDSAKLYLARGILRVQLGEFELAERDFDTADRLSGNQSISGAASSLAELQNSNLPKALAVARSKLRANSADPMLHYVKAETLKQMGAEPGTPEFKEALEAASVAVRLRPDFLAAGNLLGSLYLQNGELELARKQFEVVVRKDPLNETAIYHLIQIAKKTGKAGEIPELMNQLTRARLAQRKKDEETLRYRLIEADRRSMQKQ